MFICLLQDIALLVLTSNSIIPKQQRLPRRHILMQQLLQGNLDQRLYVMREIVQLLLLRVVFLWLPNPLRKEEGTTVQQREVTQKNVLLHLNEEDPIVMCGEDTDGPQSNIVLWTVQRSLAETGQDPVRGISDLSVITREKRKSPQGLLLVIKQQKDHH